MIDFIIEKDTLLRFQDIITEYVASRFSASFVTFGD